MFYVHLLKYIYTIYRDFYKHMNVKGRSRALYHATGVLPVEKMAVKLKHDLSILMNLNIAYFCLTLKENSPDMPKGPERVSDSYRLKPPR